MSGRRPGDADKLRKGQKGNRTHREQQNRWSQRLPKSSEAASTRPRLTITAWRGRAYTATARRRVVRAERISAVMITAWWILPGGLSGWMRWWA